MKQPFDLSLWLQDKSRKIVTRDGRSVRIICWDVKGPFPILALIMGNGEMDTKVGEEYPCSYKVDGTCPVSDSYNLFFADEELTEFEKTMIQFSHERNSLIQFEHTTEEINAHLYLYSEKLLDLARKEIRKEEQEELIRKIKEQ